MHILLCQKKKRDTVFQVLYKHFIGMSISMLCEPEVSFVTVRADSHDAP